MLFIYSLLLKIFFLSIFALSDLEKNKPIEQVEWQPLTGHTLIPKPQKCDLILTDSFYICSYFKDPFQPAFTINLIQHRVTSLAQEEVLIEGFPRADWQVGLFVKICLDCHN